MVFSSLYNLNEVPFKNVYFTGLIRDELGRKMSKSLGNGIDPIEIIDKYGADALRFTLVGGNTPGNDMRFYEKRVESNRNFANKKLLGNLGRKYRRSFYLHSLFLHYRRTRE